MKRDILRSLTLLLVVAAPAVASAGSPPEPPGERAWGVEATTTTTVGQKMFDDDSDQERMNQSLELRPYYRPGAFFADLEIGAVQWFTNAEVYRDGWRFQFQDIAASSGYRFDVPPVDLGIEPALRVIVPTSKLSWQQSRMLTAGTSVRLLRTFLERVHLSLEFSGSKAFHRFKGRPNSLDEEPVFGGNPHFRTAGSDDLANAAPDIFFTSLGENGPPVAAIGQTNVEYSAGGIAAVEFVVGDFRPRIEYGRFHYWSYRTTSTNPVSGETSIIERGKLDVSHGVVQLAWQPRFTPLATELVLRAATRQFSTTPDARATTFPFWNLGEYEGNPSVLQLGITGRF